MALSFDNRQYTGLTGKLMTLVGNVLASLATRFDHAAWHLQRCPTCGRSMYYGDSELPCKAPGRSA